jgi:hypothetical protein
MLKVSVNQGRGCKRPPLMKKNCARRKLGAFWHATMISKAILRLATKVYQYQINFATKSGAQLWRLVVAARPMASIGRVRVSHASKLG